MTEETKNTNKKHNIAYIIASLPGNRQLEVRKSANAWWMDPHKVYDLFAAFRLCSTINEACAYAGVTLKQYKYFVRLHPIVPEIRESYEADLIIQARMNIARAIDNGDRKISWKYLEIKLPEEFGKSPRKGKNNYIDITEIITAEELEHRNELETKEQEEKDKKREEEYKKSMQRKWREDIKRQEMYKKNMGL